jgi:DNA repair protein RecN (Recombination protein N)
MLRTLRVRNYAVIEDVDLALGPGLNVLTGETGAGKSILVDALALLLGERAHTDVIRTGADRARVEGVFDLGTRPDLVRLCEERGLEVADGLLVLTREVSAEGRSRAWISGSPVTATVMGEVGRALVDLHGQHEHQTLLRPDEQRGILDAYAGASELAAELRRLHEAWAAVRARRAELEEFRARVRERAELLRHQVEEIEGARVRPGEDRELEELERRWSHAEEWAALVGGLYEAWYEGDDAVVARLGALRRRADALVRIDASCADVRDALESALQVLQEAGRRLAELREGADYDPARLEDVRRRLDLLYRLKSKYGPELADVLETARRARAELDAMDEAALEWEECAERAASLERERAERARALSEARAGAAGALAREVTRLLPELGMPDGRFEVALLPLSEVGPDGAESVEFRVTLNPGFEPRPLARVASGGELSRVMLALKTVLARLDRIPTLVFDEIDAGIGGVVGARVGAMLKAVSAHHQVLVITHLPQIAARADHHVRVTKTTEAGRARALVDVVAGGERVRELARMLGGDPESEVSLEHARAMLAAADAGPRAERGVSPAATGSSEPARSARSPSSARSRARGRRRSSS